MNCLRLYSLDTKSRLSQEVHEEDTTLYYTKGSGFAARRVSHTFELYRLRNYTFRISPIRLSFRGKPLAFQVPSKLLHLLRHKQTEQVRWAHEVCRKVLCRKDKLAQKTFLRFAENKPPMFSKVPYHPQVCFY